MRCVPAAQRETAANLADENCSDEAVQTDRQDSRGLQETCERRDWRIRDPTWRRNPTWRKSEKSDEISQRKSEFCWRKKLFVTSLHPDYVHEKVTQEEPMQHTFTGSPTLSVERKLCKRKLRNQGIFCLAISTQCRNQLQVFFGLKTSRRPP